MYILSTDRKSSLFKQRRQNTRNRYHKVPHLTQDTIWESYKNTTKHHTQESQEVRPSAGDRKAATGPDPDIAHSGGGTILARGQWGPRQGLGRGFRGKMIFSILMALESSTYHVSCIFFSSLEYIEMPLTHIYACNMMSTATTT